MIEGGLLKLFLLRNPGLTKVLGYGFVDQAPVQALMGRLCRLKLRVQLLLLYLRLHFQKRSCPRSMRLLL
jgi:hypothetical protein